MTSPRLVCLDTVMIDFALDIVALPARGGDALASRRLVTPGGGFNVMSATRRQGVGALYVGQLGVGRFADIARAVLTHEGIDVAVIPRGEVDLGVCVVLVDGAGERTFVTSPGAELQLGRADVAGVEPATRDVVYVSGYNVVYPELAGVVVEWLARLAPGVVVAFDPGPRAADIEPEILGRVMARADWLLCNIAEARLWCPGRDAAESSAQLLARGGHALVVVRDGARGCVGATTDQVIHSPGFVAQVVDTNGAGDVHNGVVIAEILRGTALEETLLRANAAAAIAIETFGPATAPSRTLVDARLTAAPNGSGG